MGQKSRPEWPGKFVKHDTLLNTLDQEVENESTKNSRLNH